MSFKGRPSSFGYGTSKVGRNQYSNAAVGTTVDLREEFDRLVYGTGDCPREGHPVQIWFTRRDSNGAPQSCVCRNDLTKDPDFHCSYCRGVGYYWDGQWTLTRQQWVGSGGGLSNKDRVSPPGYVEAEQKIFYLRYDTNIRMGDFIVECALDSDGGVKLDSNDQPFFTAYYTPQTVAPRRGKNGRIEYYAVYCLERNAIRPNTFMS